MESFMGFGVFNLLLTIICFGKRSEVSDSDFFFAESFERFGIFYRPFTIFKNNF